jgi:hypothetical protein
VLSGAACFLRAQTPIAKDTLIPPVDSFALILDSLFSTTDTIRFSKDSLDAPVTYDARDSMILDLAAQKVFLYGGAIVKYTTITLKADFIVFDWASSIVTAEGFPDSTGNLAGFPEFSEGEQTFNAKRLRYNFQSGKGMIYDAISQQNDILIHGERSKFVRGTAEDTAAISDDAIYSYNGIFTTCTAEHPHFGIRARKLKIVPEKMVVVGPSNLEIAGVPTPLWLPFGFFPIPSGKQTGLLFPSDYEYSDQWGFGLRDVGWYFPVNDNLNLQLKGDIYLKGTWGLNTVADYRKRYRYNGSLRLNYDSRRTEGSDGKVARTNSFGINWSHSQDRAAHPSRSFGGSVNIQTNNNQQRRFNDAQSVLQTQLSSNLSYNKSWPGRPFSLNASFNHSQNAITREMNITLPNIQFLTQALYPFKRKEAQGQAKWYENVVLRYTGEMSNRFVTTDTTLFSKETWENARFGVRHSADAGTSLKVLKYFNLNPGIRYGETWYLESTRREFTPDLVIDTIFDQGVERYDTIRVGRIEEFKDRGFSPFRTFSASLSLTTQIFGTLRFKQGYLRGLRHVIKPNVSLSYAPDYLNPNLGYFRTVQDSLDAERIRMYSAFEGGIYGGPPQSGRQLGVSYSLNNIFEAKIRGKRDTVDKKIKLFDNLIVGGFYNFAADSLKWSPINASGTARFFQGMTTLGMAAQLDPYITDDRGQRINTTVWDSRGAPFRFVNADLRLNTSMTVGRIREMIKGKPREDENNRETGTTQIRQPVVGEEDLLSLFENFAINHNIAFDIRPDTSGKVDFKVLTNSINAQGSIKLTQNWGISVGNFGYDFQRRGLSFPSFGFTRDLHCWNMAFNWQPTRGTYNFFIAVKPGSLDFLNIPYQRNNADTLRAFQ